MELVELYRKGQYSQAFSEGNDKFGSLDKWEDQVLAGRLAQHIGSPRVGTFLHLREARRNAKSLKAQAYAGLHLLRRFGPWHTHRFIESHQELYLACHDPESLVDWLGLQVLVQGAFRDFPAARLLLEQARNVDQTNLWLDKLEAGLLEDEDRREEALEFLESLEESEDSWRATLPTRAHLLSQLNRADDALALLRDSAGRIESCWLYAHLGHLLIDRELFHEALEAYKSFSTSALLTDKSVQRWLNNRLFDCYYHLGEWDLAIESVGANPAPALRQMVENLKRASPEYRRKKLPVELIRQHHSTCAPATLSSIVKFWGHEADHLGLAEEICYDGTSVSAQRIWAEKNHWVTREFTLDWEQAVSLIDQNLPFTLTTVELDSAHLQAIIGYDERLKTLLVRDPSSDTTVTLIAEKAFERYASSGPRAMLLAPRESAERIQQELPDWELYELSDHISRYLEEQNRARAELTFAEMLKRAPEHRLTKFAELAIARHDEDENRALNVYHSLTTQYPQCPRLTLALYGSLQRLSRHREARSLLERVTQDPKCEPLFRSYLALDYLEDARLFPVADRLFRNCLMEQPHNSQFYRGLGDLRWRQRRFEEALQLKKIASCLADKDEDLAKEYFQACCQLGYIDTGLKYLEDRSKKFSAKRSDAAQSYYYGLRKLGKTQEAQCFLSELLDKFPQDTALKMFAAENYCQLGNFEKAQRLLDESRLDAPELKVLRAQAHLEASRGDLLACLENWRMIAKREPTASDAQFALVSLLETLNRPEESKEYLKDLSQSFPNNVNIAYLKFTTLANSEHPQTESSLRDFLKLSPNSAFAWRKLALILERKSESKAADKALEQAQSLEPNEVEYFHTLAELERSRGRLLQAKIACKKAVEVNISQALDSVTLLTELCEDRQSLKKELAWIWEQIERQKNNLGQSLLLYQSLAAPLLDPQHLLARLTEFNQERWVTPEERLAVILQAQYADEDKSALEHALASIDEFPYSNILRNALADTYGKLDDPENERLALEKSLSLDPSSSMSLRRLSDHHLKAGDADTAVKYLSQALLCDPQNALNHGYLADLYWNQGKKEESISSLRQALLINPGYEWAWEMLFRWSHLLGHSRGALEIAQELVELRPKDSRNWLRLVQYLPIDAHEERLDALEQALKFAPLSAEAHLAKINYLTELERYDEALAACRPEAWGGNRPVCLKVRECNLRAELGEPEAALNELRDLLKEEPDSFQGWAAQTEWLLNTGKIEDSFQSAQEMQKRFPTNPGAHQIAAILCRKLGKDPRDALRRGLRLDPTDQDSALELLEASRSLEDFAVLKTDLQTVRLSALELPLALCYDIVIALGEKDDESLRELLQKLFRTETDRQSYSFVNTLCQDYFKGDFVREALVQSSEEPNSQLFAGVLYCQILAPMGKKKQRIALKELPLEGEFTMGFLGEYISELSVAELKTLMKTDRNRLRAHNFPWANVGMCYLSTDGANLNELLEWTSDWKDRTGLESWMLFNRSVALRELGREQEAHDLDLILDREFEPDNNWHNLKTCLALDFVKSAQIEKAKLSLAAVNREYLSGYYTITYDLAKSGLAALEGQIEQAKSVMRSSYVDEAPKNWPPIHKSHQKLVLSLIQSRGTGFSHHIWCMTQHMWREQNKIMFAFWLLWVIFFANAEKLFST